jgi:hypothetical protein
MSAYRPWSEVKRHAMSQRAELLESLVTAKPDDVLAIQTRIQTIDQFVAWFESAPGDTTIGSAEVSGY